MAPRTSGHLERGRSYAGDSLDLGPTGRVERAQKRAQEAVRHEGPRARPRRDRPHDGAARDSRHRHEKADVPAVRDHFEGGSRSGGDRPRARERPVRDDALRLDARDPRSSAHDPVGRLERAKRMLANARRDPRPPEGPSSGRRDDDHVVPLPLERAGAGSDEMTRRVPLCCRPARRHERDAHGVFGLQAMRAPRPDGKIRGEMTSPGAAVTFGGRILFLTEDPSLLESQLAGEDLDPGSTSGLALVDNISTDEITPGWVCYYYDETLARYCLVGLRGGKVAARRDQERRLRRHRQRHLEGLRHLARDGALQRARGGRAARHRQEHREDLPAERAEHRPPHEHRLRRSSSASQRGEEIPIERVHARASTRSAPTIVEHGGLFAYNKARLAGEVVAAGDHDRRRGR